MSFAVIFRFEMVFNRASGNVTSFNAADDPSLPRQLELLASFMSIPLGVLDTIKQNIIIRILKLILRIAIAAYKGIYWAKQ